MEMNDYQTIAEAVPEESTAVTLLKALLGAVVGSLPAVFLWIVLGKAGYVAAIAGFFMFLGSIIACDKFTSKSSNMNIWAGVVICAVVMIINVYLCERFVWSWEMSDALNEYSEGEYHIGIFDCFRNFTEFTALLEVQEDFTLSLVKSYIFALLGGVAGVRKLAKK